MPQDTGSEAGDRKTPELLDLVRVQTRFLSLLEFWLIF